MIRGTSRSKAASSPRRRKESSASRRKVKPRSAKPKASASRVAAHSRTRSAAKASTKTTSTAKKSTKATHEAVLKNFEAAVRSFRKKDYQKAAPLFEKVAAGPIHEVADRARVHLNLCKLRQQQEKPPKTAEGYYARGVAALNSCDFDLAIQYLSKSDKMVPDQEYVHYALAAAYGLRGDSDPALDHLEIAIKLRPQNRVQARLDDDFQGLASDPRFIQLLGSDGHQALA